MKIKLVLFVIIVAIGLSLTVVGCNNVPADLRGTYSNPVAGSSWVVGQKTVSSDQALLYSYTYNNHAYGTFVVWDTNEASFSVDLGVTAAGLVAQGYTGLSKVNKITTKNLRADSALGDSSDFYDNISLTVVGYQFEYMGITYLVAEGCEHILVG